MKIALLLTILVAGCSSVKKKTSEFKLDTIEKKESAFFLKWIKNLDPVYNTGNLPIGTASPFIFEDIVYMGNLSGEMVAYDIDTGEVIWKHDEKYPVQSQVNKLGDYVYYGTRSGRLISRHYLTGKLNYAVDLGAPVETQPSFIAGRLVLHLRNHTIITVDAKTGKVFWRYKRSIPYVTTLQRVSQVLNYKNAIIVGFADGYIVSLNIDEGVVNWEQKISTGVKFVDVDVMPVFHAGNIIAGSAAGPMRFINPDTGVIEKTVEVFQSHTPYINGENMIVGSVSGTLYKIDRFGKILKSKKLSEDGISSIRKWKQGLVVTTMGSKIYYVQGDDMVVKSSFDLGSDQSAIFGTSIIGENGELAVYSSRNRLYLFL